MNAYELADKLWEFHNAFNLGDVQCLIREQADRIAELEKDLALKTRDRDVFRNFTLAYEERIAELEKLVSDMIYEKSSGVYDRPQTKPLSDADIEQISHRYHYTYNPDYIGFARAIEERILGNG